MIRVTFLCVRHLFAIAAAMFILACDVVSEQVPESMKDLPLREAGPAPPISCRDSVDSTLAGKVDSAENMIWVKGKSWQGVEILENALSRDPYLVRAYMALGTWYGALAPQKALLLLNNGIEHCPKEPWLTLGAVLAKGDSVSM